MKPRHLKMEIFPSHKNIREESITSRLRIKYIRLYCATTIEGVLGIHRIPEEDSSSYERVTNTST